MTIPDKIFQLYFKRSEVEKALSLMGGCLYKIDKIEAYTKDLIKIEDLYFNIGLKSITMAKTKILISLQKGLYYKIIFKKD